VFLSTLGVYNAAPCGEQACTFVDLKATDHEESGVGGESKKKWFGCDGAPGSSAFAICAKMLKYHWAERKTGKRLPQPGRKSAAELAVNPPPPRASRLRPPPSLAEPEAKLFKQIVSNSAYDHFRPSDLPLLTRYCESSILAERAAAELRKSPVLDGKPSPWLYVREKSVRDLVALSMRLRLSPQARAKGHTLPAKSRTDPGGLGVGWWQLGHDDGDEDDDDARTDQR
jgi:phage terminase small subunit